MLKVYVRSGIMKIKRNKLSPFERIKQEIDREQIENLKIENEDLKTIISEQADALIELAGIISGEDEF